MHQLHRARVGHGLRIARHRNQEILIREAERLLAAHAEEAEAVMAQPPNLVAVALHIFDVVRIDRVIDLVGRRLADVIRRQQLFAVHAAAVHHEVGHLRQIHRARQNAAAAPAVAAGGFDAGDILPHPHRFKDALPQQILKILPRNALHDYAEHQRAGCVILENRAALMRGRGFKPGAHPIHVRLRLVHVIGRVVVTIRHAEQIANGRVLHPMMHPALVVLGEEIHHAVAEL